MKKDLKVFIPNINQPLSLDIKSTSGHQKLDLAIKEMYEYVWKNCLEISETNMKYHFWLKMIVEPNNFNNLYDVREYLIENMVDKEHSTEHIEAILNTIYNNLQLKIINIINEIDECLTIEKCTIVQSSEIIGKENKSVVNEFSNEKLGTNAEIKLQHATEEHQRKVDTKLKLLETENKKLNKKEAEYSKQIKSLLGELSFRNRKLSNTKERIAVLTKEKNDLISTIEKMEVKDVSFQTLQNRFAKEQEKNKRLRDVIESEYQRVII